MSDYDTVKVTKDNLTELLAKEAYHRGRYDGCLLYTSDAADDS